MSTFVPRLMNFSRRASRVLDRIEPQVTSWLTASIILTFGLLTWFSPEVIESQSWHVLLGRLAPIWFIGLAATTGGLTRLAMLVIEYRDPTNAWAPRIRFPFVVMSVLVWSQIVIALMVEQKPSLGFAVWPYILVLDIYNIYVVGSDIASKSGSKDGRR